MRQLDKYIQRFKNCAANYRKTKLDQNLNKILELKEALHKSEFNVRENQQKEAAREAHIQQLERRIELTSTS